MELMTRVVLVEYLLIYSTDIGQFVDSALQSSIWQFGVTKPRLRRQANSTPAGYAMSLLQILPLLHSSESPRPGGSRVAPLTAHSVHRSHRDSHSVRVSHRSPFAYPRLSLRLLTGGEAARSHGKRDLRSRSSRVSLLAVALPDIFAHFVRSDRAGRATEVYATGLRPFSPPGPHRNRTAPHHDPPQPTPSLTAFVRSSLAPTARPPHWLTASPFAVPRRSLSVASRTRRRASAPPAAASDHALVVC